jgi:hypothetical protein
MTRKGQWAAPSLAQAAELCMGQLPREFADETELSPAALRIYQRSRPHRETFLPGSPSLPVAPASSPRLRLNPLFVLWLQGFPESWLDL